MVSFLSPSTHYFYLCLLYLLLLLLSSAAKVYGKTASSGSSCSSSSSLDVVGSQTWRSIQLVRRRQQRQQPAAFARPYAGIFHRGSPTTRTCTCTCTALAIAANTLNLLLPVRGGEHDQPPNTNTNATTNATTNINFDDDKHVVYRRWSCLF